MTGRVPERLTAARPAGMAARSSILKARWRWVDHDTDEPPGPLVRLRQGQAHPLGIPHVGE